jgi:phosphopantetheine--protein transferase-like protein
MKIGIDLVHLPKFIEKIKDETLLQRLFTDEELREAGGSAETLAGMFAAKEAYFKAVRHTPEWHAVQLRHDTDGAPQLVARGQSGEISVSISHDGEYVTAVAMINDFNR